MLTGGETEAEKKTICKPQKEASHDNRKPFYTMTGEKRRCWKRRDPSDAARRRRLELCSSIVSAEEKKKQGKSQTPENSRQKPTINENAVPGTRQIMRILCHYDDKRGTSNRTPPPKGIGQ